MLSGTTFSYFFPRGIRLKCLLVFLFFPVGHQVALWLTVFMDTHPDKTVFHTCWSCDDSEDIQIRHVVYELPTYLAYRYFRLFSSCETMTVLYLDFMLHFLQRRSTQLFFVYFLYKIKQLFVTVRDE